MNMKDDIKKVNKVSAVQNALENLRKYIKDSNVKILPSESEISKSLGVSRLTLREAIIILEKEGLVSRIQGKGTLVNTFVTKLDNRLDTGNRIEDVLKNNGYDIRFEVFNVEYKIASKYEQIEMGINENDEILVIEKLLYANDKLVALYVDRIPKKFLKTFNFEADYFKSTIFQIIDKITGLKISHDVIKIKAVACDKKQAQLFNIEENTPLISFDILEYNRDGLVVMYNTEYYTDEPVDFTICRNVAYKAWS